MAHHLEGHDLLTSAVLAPSMFLTGINFRRRIYEG